MKLGLDDDEPAPSPAEAKEIVKEVIVEVKEATEICSKCGQKSFHIDHRAIKYILYFLFFLVKKKEKH